MKTKDVAKRYGIETLRSRTGLSSPDIDTKQVPWGGLDVDDSQNIDAIVDSFKQHHAEQQQAARQAEVQRQRAAQQVEVDRERAAQQKPQALAVSS